MHRVVVRTGIVDILQVMSRTWEGQRWNSAQHT